MPCNEIWPQLYTYNDCVGWIPRDNTLMSNPPPVWHWNGLPVSFDWPTAELQMPGYYPWSDSKDAEDIFGGQSKWTTCEKCGHQCVDPEEGCIPCQFKAERERKKEQERKNCKTCAGSGRMRWPSQSFYVPCPVCYPEQFRRCGSEWNGCRWDGWRWSKRYDGSQKISLVLKCEKCGKPLPFERVCSHCSTPKEEKTTLKCVRDPEMTCSCHGDYCPPAAPADGKYPIKNPFRVANYSGQPGVITKRTATDRVRVKWDGGNEIDEDIKDLSEVETAYKVTSEWLDQCQLIVLPHSPFDDMVKNPGFDEKGNRIGCGQCDNCLFGCACLYHGPWCVCHICIESRQKPIETPKLRTQTVTRAPKKRIIIPKKFKKRRGKPQPEPEFKGSIECVEDYSSAKSLGELLCGFYTKIFRESTRGESKGD